MHSLTIGALKSRRERQKHQCQSKQSDVRKILLDTASFEDGARRANPQNVLTPVAEKGNGNRTLILRIPAEDSLVHSLILSCLELQWTPGSSTVQQ